MNKGFSADGRNGAWQYLSASVQHLSRARIYTKSTPLSWGGDDTDADPTRGRSARRGKRPVRRLSGHLKEGLKAMARQSEIGSGSRKEGVQFGAAEAKDSPVESVRIEPAALDVPGQRPL